MSRAWFERFLFAIVAFLLFVMSGCGYHTSAHMELRSRTEFHVVVTNDGDTADATLKGLVNYTANSPLTYDSVTGRISSSVVTIAMKVSLVSKSGKVLWDNPNYIYREQYQVSRDVASFFDESNPAFLRIANEFAKALVSNIVEAY